MKTGNNNIFKKQYIKQINNLKIYFTPWFQYSVETFSKIVLEDRMTLQQAEDFCKNTKDFIVNKKRKVKRW